MKVVRDPSVLNRLNRPSSETTEESSVNQQSQGATLQPRRVQDQETLSILNLPSGRVESVGEFQMDASDVMRRAQLYQPNLAEQLQEQATSKETAVTVGATAGSVIGSGLGLPGTIAGGALGAAAVSSIYDYFEMMNSPEPHPTDFINQQIQNSVNEGVSDAVIATGTGAAFNLAGQLGRRILGLGKQEAQRIFEAGSRRGINLGPFYLQEGARQRFVNFSSRIAGPFPLAGAGFKSAQRRLNTEYVDSVGRFLDSIAPSSTVFNLSGRSASSARETYRRYRGIYDALYKEVENVANSMPRPDIFLTRSIKGQAQTILDSIQRSTPTTRQGQVQSRRVSAQVTDFLSDMSNLSDRQSIEQLRAIKQDAASLMESESTSNTAKSYLEQIRIAAEQSLSDVDTSVVPSERAEQLVGSLERANRFFSRTMGEFEKPTAQQFQRFDRNLFRAGRTKPGDLNADELLNSIVNTNSRVGLQNLRFLLQRSNARDADRIYNRVVRNHLDGIFETAKRTQEGAEQAQSRFIFDYNSLRKSLDLENPDKRAIYEQMFKGTDYSVQALEDFLEIARKADGAIIPSSSAFIGRRMALGGVASGISAITPAGGVAGSTALVLGLNGIQKVLTSPSLSRSLVRLSELDPNSFAFRALGSRLAEDLSFSEEEQLEAQREAERQLIPEPAPGPFMMGDR